MTQAAAPLQVHAAHLVLLFAWVAVAAAGYLKRLITSHRRGRAPIPAGRQSWRSGTHRWTNSVAACYAAAAVIHLSVIREHFAESGLYGTFFLALTSAQLGFAALILRRPSPALLNTGALACLAVVGLWAVSRSVGIPVGPEPGHAEPVGTLDLLATGAELLIVALSIRARTTIPAPLSPPGSRCDRSRIGT